jgi:hypothetical protein
MLAGSALASLTVSVTANSIIQGFAAALDSLLPQAWTSEHPTHVGLWTQRMMVLMTFIIMVSNKNGYRCWLSDCAAEAHLRIVAERRTDSVIFKTRS